MRTILTCIIFWLGLSGVQAQLTEADTLPLGYRLTLGGSWITGNVDRLLLTAGAEIAAVGEKTAFRTANAYQYGTFAGFQTENDFSSKNFFYLYPRRKLYPYAMGWMESNFRRQYPFRYQVGPGASWSFAPGAKLSLTATFEQTWFNGTAYSDQTYDGSDQISAFRLTARVFGQHRLAAGRMRLRYEAWFQPSVEDWENYRIHGEVSAELPLGKRISFRTAWQYNYETVVLETIKNQDTFWVFGLTVGNYK